MAKELEISESTLVRWRGQIGESSVRQTSASLTPREMEQRLAQLERENEILRKEKKIAEMEREVLKNRPGRLGSPTSGRETARSVFWGSRRKRPNAFWRCNAR